MVQDGSECKNGNENSSTGSEGTVCYPVGFGATKLRTEWVPTEAETTLCDVLELEMKIRARIMSVDDAVRGGHRDRRYVEVTRTGTPARTLASVSLARGKANCYSGKAACDEVDTARLEQSAV